MVIGPRGRIGSISPIGPISSMSKKTIIIIIIAVIVILLSGAIIFLLLNKKSPQGGQELNNSANDNSQVSENAGEKVSQVSEAVNGYWTYTNFRYKFSFQCPEAFNVTDFDEEDTQTILVSKKDTKDGFQIFIAPFDEPGPITKERILEDLPDFKIESPEQRLLKNGETALIFFTEDSSVGKTREIWFVHNGYLYQITTIQAFDAQLVQIMNTWKFEN